MYKNTASRTYDLIPKGLTFESAKSQKKKRKNAGQKNYLKKYLTHLVKYIKPTDSKSLENLKQDKLEEIHAYRDYSQPAEKQRQTIFF